MPAAASAPERLGRTAGTDKETDPHLMSGSAQTIAPPSALAAVSSPGEASPCRQGRLARPSPSRIRRLRRKTNRRRSRSRRCSTGQGHEAADRGGGRRLRPLAAARPASGLRRCRGGADPGRPSAPDRGGPRRAGPDQASPSARSKPLKAWFGLLPTPVPPEPTPSAARRGMHARAAVRARRPVPRLRRERSPWKGGTGGSVAKIAAGREWPRWAAGQAAVWNSPATKPAWARMSRPPMPRTCPFLTIAIAS